MSENETKTKQRGVSGSAFVATVLDSMNFATQVVNVLQIVDDATAAQAALADVKGLSGLFKAGWGSWAKKTGAELVTDAQSTIEAIQKAQADSIYNQLARSAMGHRMTTAMLGYQAKEQAFLDAFDARTDMLFGFPRDIALRKVERYWNKELTPELPSDKESFMLYRLGKWSLDQYISRKQEIQGLTYNDAKNIADMLEWQTGKPSLREAYLMVSKGLWTVEKWLNLATKGYGMTVEDAKAYYTHLSYDPSPSELLRMSDLIPLEPSWVALKLRALGLDAIDAGHFSDAIAKRAIRDEVNRAWALMLDLYQWGLYTEATIESKLTAWKFSTAEIDLRIDIANDMRVKLRLKLLRDAEIYYYRKGIIDEDTLLVRLTTLGIEKSVANAIVRNEAAKKGVVWEIPEE